MVLGGILDSLDIKKDEREDGSCCAIEEMTKSSSGESGSATGATGPVETIVCSVAELGSAGADWSSSGRLSRGSLVSSFDWPSRLVSKGDDFEKTQVEEVVRVDLSSSMFRGELKKTFLGMGKNGDGGENDDTCCKVDPRPDRTIVTKKRRSLIF